MKIPIKINAAKMLEVVFFAALAVILLCFTSVFVFVTFNLLTGR